MSALAHKAASVIVRASIHLRNRLKSNRRFMSFYEGLAHDIESSHSFANLYEHDRMLADEVRVNSYYRALTKYVKEGDLVIDLGTGSGILSFLASSKNPRRIYALDHSPIIAAAKSVAQSNRITNIEFINANSKAFSISEKVDLIIHEQIGDYLFEEDMVGKIVDLRDRLLKRGGRILPSTFEFFIVPVKLKDEYRVPFIWEQRLHNINFACLKDIYKDKIPGYYYHRSIRPYEVDYALGEPEKVFAFDLGTIKVSDLPRSISYRGTVKRDGVLDGFCLGFEVIFDEEISFSPLKRQTSWAVPLLRVEAKEYKRGDSIEFNLTIGDFREPNTWKPNLT